jgi:hypothetical protein
MQMENRQRLPRLIQATQAQIAQSAQALMSSEREIAFVKTEMNSKQQRLVSSRESILTLRAKIDQLRFENGQLIASGMSHCRAVHVFARIQVPLCRICGNGRVCT